MEEKPEIKLESKIDWQIKQGSGLGFAGLGPRQVGVRGGSAGRAGQPRLGSALQGWVLGRWQSGQGSQGRAVGLTGADGAWLGFAGLSPRQGRWGRQVAVRAGQVGHRPGQSGQVGAAGAWLVFAGLGPRAAGAQLGFAGLGPRHTAAVAAGARLGFDGLGPRQASGQVGRQAWLVGRLAGSVGRQLSRQAGWSAGQAGRQAGWQAGRQTGRLVGGAGRQPGLRLAFLGWVLGRRAGMQAWLVGSSAGRQAGRQLSRQAGWSAGQAARQPGRAGWQAGRQTGRLVGGAGRQVGRTQGRALGFAGLGPRQVAGRAAGAWLSFAGLGPRQVGRLAGLAGQFGLAGAAGAAGAWLGSAGLGPRQAGRAGQKGSIGKSKGQDLTFSLKVFNSFGLKKLAKTLEASEMDAKIVVDQKDNCIVVKEDGDEDKFSDSDLIAEFNGKNSDTFVPALLVKVWLRYWELVSRAAWARLGLAVACFSFAGRVRSGWAGWAGQGRSAGPNPNPASFAILVYSDGLRYLATSALQHLVLEILYLLLANILLQKITLAWRPGHKDMKVNERLDNIAKREAWTPAMDSLEANKFVADSPRRHQWQKSIFDLEASLAGIVGELHTGHIGDYTPFPLILSSLQDAGTLSPA
ncbi:hypothetical protein PPACK8108_LOCUS17044 [Phakopsora pachyrhizi]|uniref:PB1 domain-containing protein n=1 Tax=Phakopsora pachyrhizi TaxID=170000 RepID=A0AAV0BBX6_PHAPC|nr:hypothetical protein PPACK8108_LOCUS17044 [Phakopsora pachyrhizi]